MYIECDDGWKKLYEPLVKATEASGGKVLQIKEKFGALRFYTQGNPEWLKDLITQIEFFSEHVCEYCGKPGKLRNDRLWLKTLCEECK